MALNYNFINYGAKADINDKVSVGVFFDQPWGADVEFTGNNNFVNGTVSAQQVAGAGQAAQAAATAAKTAAAAKADPTNQTLAYNAATAVKTEREAGAAYNIASNIAQHPNEGTNVSVDSKNFTGLLGVKFGEKNNWQVYGGPVLQKLEGEVHLRGTAYNSTQGYDGIFAQSNGYGWMAGLAYSKPEIALKAALTYRFGEEHHPVTESQILSPRRWQDESDDLWTTYQRIQENLIKGGLSGLTTKGKRTHTRAVKGIDGDVKLNRALWVMAENMLQLAS